MKKNVGADLRVCPIIVIMLIIIMIGIINRNTYARVWVVPKFEVQVTDAVTGMPVENAVVLAMWNGKAAYSILSESQGADTKSKTLITNKEGKIVIPKRISIPIIGWFVPGILSSFADLTIEIDHPLYVRNGAMIYDEDIFTHEIVYKGTRQPNNTIRYDIKLVGVEEAMRRSIEKYKRTGDLGFDFGSYIGTYSGSFFKDHWDKKFAEYILEEWKRIIGDAMENKFLADKYNKIKKEVEEAYKGDK